MKNNIKTARENKGLTQQECADIFGVKLRAWQTYEQGVSEPKYELLCKIADTFGVTTDCLLGRESQQNYFAKENVPMTPDEFNDKFEQLPDNIKKSVLDVLIYLTETAEERGQKPNIEHSSKAIARTSDGSSELREPPTDEQMASFEEVTEDNF